MTDFFKRLLNQPEPPAAPDVPPAEMAAYLRSLDDRQWGRYAFSREPLEGKFTPQQKDAYTAAANACGAEWADKLAAEHDTRDPLTLCGELGLKLKTPATPAGGGQVLFAQFVQPDEITIFTDCLDKAETLGGLIPARAKLQSIILAHELFHAVEEENPEITPAPRKLSCGASRSPTKAASSVCRRSRRWRSRSSCWGWTSTPTRWMCCWSTPMMRRPPAGCMQKSAI